MEFEIEPSEPGKPPAAPKNLRVTTPLYPAVGILDALHGLADPQLIQLAPEATNRLKGPITKWAVKRYEILQRHYEGVVMIQPDSSQPPPSKSESERTFDVLTVADARQLSNVEELQMSEFETVSNDINRVQIPFVQGTMSLARATLVLEFVILVCFVWFWLNLRELTRKSTPPRSTIVSLFEASLATQLTFVAAIGLVVGSGTLLALYSFRLQKWNAALALLSTVVATRIVVETRWFRLAALLANVRKPMLRCLSAYLHLLGRFRK